MTLYDYHMTLYDYHMTLYNYNMTWHYITIAWRDIKWLSHDVKIYHYPIHDIIRLSHDIICVSHDMTMRFIPQWYKCNSTFYDETTKVKWCHMMSCDVTFQQKQHLGHYTRCIYICMGTCAHVRLKSAINNIESNSFNIDN